jgi:hypothetical protein
MYFILSALLPYVIRFEIITGEVIYRWTDFGEILYWVSLRNIQISRDNNRDNLQNSITTHLFPNLCISQLSYILQYLMSLCNC